MGGTNMNKLVSIDDINAVYTERNRLAIGLVKMALFAGYNAGKGKDPAGEPGWDNVVYVDLPNGKQVSWHIAPTEIYLLNDIPEYKGEWDKTYLGKTPEWLDKWFTKNCPNCLRDDNCTPCLMEEGRQYFIPDKRLENL